MSSLLKRQYYLLIALVLISLVIGGLAGSALQKHHTATQQASTNQVLQAMKRALSRAPNSIPSSGNLMLSAGVSALSINGSLSVQTLSGTTYLLVPTSRTTVMRGSRVVPLSTLRIGDVINVLIDVQPNGSLQPLRITLL